MPYLLKSTDAGRTWKPIFDDQPTGSIGDVAVYGRALSDTEIAPIEVIAANAMTHSG